jgi:hypothetical protein
MRPMLGNEIKAPDRQEADKNDIGPGSKKAPLVGMFIAIHTGFLWGRLIAFPR